MHETNKESMQHLCAAMMKKMFNLHDDDRNIHFLVCYFYKKCEIQNDNTNFIL